MTNEISPAPIDAPYAQDLAVSLQPGEAAVVLALPFEERNTMFGHIHGGALASLVPISTSSSMHARGAAAAELSTVSMHVDYVRAARKPVVAETRSVRRARELEFFETRITDADGNAIALASSIVRQGTSPAPAEIAGPSQRPLGSASREVVSAIQEAIAASPFLSRRRVSFAGAARGAVELSLSAAPVNLDRTGGVHEGAVLSLLDAAGATCPWTAVPATAGAGGATIALHAQILGPLPAADLVARAAVRAHKHRVHWVDVTVTSPATGDVHALGTVVYRFNEASVIGST
ncbi:PaaI family thioesterase [Sorangium sp. So ce406]|uniref:PaaI family thioesterase n=1 Tax=Sorangium sp. So ce406 TaxID=3133311 RepID=UPI003F5BA4D7